MKKIHSNYQKDNEEKLYDSLRYMIIASLIITLLILVMLPKIALLYYKIGYEKEEPKQHSEYVVEGERLESIITEKTVYFDEVNELAEYTNIDTSDISLKKEEQMHKCIVLSYMTVLIWIFLNILFFSSLNYKKERYLLNRRYDRKKKFHD